MNRLKSYFASPYISWRLIERIIIFSELPSILFFGNYYTIRPERLELELIFCIFFWLLSFIFPIERPVWQKRLYIALEIILINLALLYGIEFSNLMYFVLAKACFMLTRKDAITTIVITGLTNLSRSKNHFQSSDR